MRLLCRLARQTRLERELAAHDRNEADLAALAGPQAGLWIADCGCRWELPGAADPVWVPCDMHAERLLRMVQGEEDP